MNIIFIGLEKVDSQHGLLRCLHALLDCFYACMHTFFDFLLYCILLNNHIAVEIIVYMRTYVCI